MLNKLIEVHLLQGTRPAASPAKQYPIISLKLEIFQFHVVIPKQVQNIILDGFVLICKCSSNEEQKILHNANKADFSNYIILILTVSMQS